MDELIITLDSNNLLDVQLQNVVTRIGGVDDYEDLRNKPSINEVTLSGNKSSEELGLQPIGDYPNHALTNEEIDAILT